MKIREKVTPEWVSDQMERHALRARDLEVITQLPRQQISNWLTGINQMSLGVKCMFHLIFMLKEYEEALSRERELKNELLRIKKS
jgi:hypothetical protein